MLPTDDPISAVDFSVLSNAVASQICFLVECGWEIALTKYNVGTLHDENYLNEALREGMREAMEDGSFRFGKIAMITGGTETKSSNVIQKPDGRTDIPVFLVALFLKFGDHDPHAIIECKRVAYSDKALCKKYVVNGIDRFRDAKYSGKHKFGFMAGYVVADTPDLAQAGVNEVLLSLGRKHETLGFVEPKNKGIRAKSDHPRPSIGTDITLHHSLLVHSV